MLRNALSQSDLRGRADGSTWSAQEIADGLGNLVVNEKNMEVMLDRDVVPLMISLIGKGGDTEKECAANTLWIIAKTSKGKAKIKETVDATEVLTRLSKSANQSVQAAAKRVLLELKETSNTRGESSIYFIVLPITDILNKFVKKLYYIILIYLVARHVYWLTVSVGVLGEFFVTSLFPFWLIKIRDI